MPGIRYSKYQDSLSLIGDFFFLLIAFFLAYFLRQKAFFNFQSPDYVIVFLIYMFSWWVIASQSSYSITKRGIPVEQIIIKTLRSTLIHLTVVYLAMIVFRFYGISRLTLFISIGIELILLIGWRITFFQLLNSYRKAGFNYRRIAILGASQQSIDLYNTLIKNKHYGYKFVGFFADKKELGLELECPYYPLQNFETYHSEQGLDEVFCTLESSYEERIREIILFCEKNLIRFKLVPSFQKYLRKMVAIDFIEGIPIVLLRPEPLESSYARLLKRSFDILFSSFIILFILSWLLPLIGLLIKIESKGPMFFIQERTGKSNQTFRIIKFRSMTVNKDAHLKQATKNDSRLTQIGRFLRKTNIDELPQFFNVLMGQMSVVGPRPHMLKHTEQYAEIISKYMVRHFVKPGITGWAQLNGYRGETTQPILMEKRVEFDVWYIENWSFLLDLSIITRTIGNMLRGEKNAG